MDKLSDIAVFVRVVESGSFTDAAERLGLSKSVVSKYVTRLENQLGVRLLNRTTRRLSLTEAGSIFYSRSRRGLEEIEAAEAEITHLQETPRGTLRINVPMSFGLLHIAPAIADFSAPASTASRSARLLFILIAPVTGTDTNAPLGVIKRHSLGES
ncbi:LysR family transcriptional regulator [Pseudomonadota bacterium]